MFLISIMPWHIMQSRWGLDCNLLSSMIIISIYVFSISKKNWQYVIAGILFGITLYTYALSYIIVPLVLFLILTYCIYMKKIKFKNLVAMGIPIFLLALPLMLMILINNGFIPEIKTNFITIPKMFHYRGNEIQISEFFQNMKSIKDIYLNDKIIWNCIPEFGALYQMSIPFLVLGFIISIYEFAISLKRKEYSISSFMLFLFVANLVLIGLTEDMNMNKANSIFIPSIYFICLSIRFIYRQSKMLFITTIILYLINAGMFINYYFNQYMKEYPQIKRSGADFMEVVKYVNTIEGHNIYFKTSVGQSWIYVLYVTEESPYYFHETFHQESIYHDPTTYAYGKYYFTLPEEIQEDGIYVMTKEEGIEKELIDKGFQKEEYLSYKIYYKT